MFECRFVNKNNYMEYARSQTNWVPRIGERVEMNGKLYDVCDVIYGLQNGTYARVNVLILVTPSK